MWIGLQVPVVRRKPWGIMCAVLNIIPVPGFGSMLAGARDDHVTHFGVGLIQLGLIIVGVVFAVIFVYVGLALFTIGFVWSVVWGVRIFLKSTPENPS